MWLQVAFIASLMPIWREADIDKPLNAWQMIAINLKRKKKHISVEEAIARAKEAGYIK